MMSDWTSTASSARRWASSVSTCSMRAAFVPSSGEKGNTPARSMRTSRRKSHNSSKAASSS